MKRILLGCSAIVLLGVSIPGYVIAKHLLQRQARQGDCKAVEPTIEVFQEVMYPFYQEVIEAKETHDLALQSATKVEAKLSKLSTIHLKNTSLNEDHKIVVENLKLFVTDARAWAVEPRTITYASFVSKRSEEQERPRGFRNVVAGGAQMGFIIDYCN